MQLLQFEVYRSTQAVAMHDKKVIVLVGDSLAGAVFARGLNKALLESALLVEAVNQFSKRSVEVMAGQIPEEFQRYEQAAFKVFTIEKRWAVFKATGLKVVRFVLRWTVKTVLWLLTPFKRPFAYFKSFVIKEPKLGDLLERIESVRPKQSD